MNLRWNEVEIRSEEFQNYVLEEELIKYVEDEKIVHNIDLIIEERLLVDPHPQHDTEEISNKMKIDIFTQYNEFACDANKKYNVLIKHKKDLLKVENTTDDNLKKKLLQELAKKDENDKKNLLNASPKKLVGQLNKIPDMKVKELLDNLSDKEVIIMLDKVSVEELIKLQTVSYTHLTLPTKRIV